MESFNNDWKTRVYNFGDVKEGSKNVEYTFEYEGEKEYKDHSSSCGCTTGKWGDNKIKVTYVLGKVPEHVKREKGYMDIIKKVFINFKDGHQDELRLTGRIYPA